MLRALIPLAIFIALVALLWVGLGLNPREVPSPLIDKPAPVFSLPRLYQPEVTVGNGDLQGEVMLFNVWASWCVTCREEHPLLVELARNQTVRLVGLNYKDQDQDAKRWLAQFGNPYEMSLVDADGRAGIDWGVYGVPETFVVDAGGVIRHKHIGAIDRRALDEEILPLVRKLQAGG